MEGRVLDNWGVVNDKESMKALNGLSFEKLLQGHGENTQEIERLQAENTRAMSILRGAVVDFVNEVVVKQMNRFSERDIEQGMRGKEVVGRVQDPGSFDLKLGDFEHGDVVVTGFEDAQVLLSSGECMHISDILGDKSCDYITDFTTDKNSVSFTCNIMDLEFHKKAKAKAIMADVSGKVGGVVAGAGVDVPENGESVPENEVGAGTNNFGYGNHATAEGYE